MWLRIYVCTSACVVGVCVFVCVPCIYENAYVCECMSVHTRVQYIYVCSGCVCMFYVYVRACVCVLCIMCMCVYECVQREQSD